MYMYKYRNHTENNINQHKQQYNQNTFKTFI